MTSFLDRLKAKMNGLNRPLFAVGKQREKVRQVIVTNRWDERVYTEARKTEPIDNLISDLSLGDEHKGGQRKPFDAAPELIKDLFMSFYKAAPRLEDKRNLERDVYAVRKVVEELLANPKLQELHELTDGDPIMSTVALDAMAEQVREIVGRIPPPPPPPQPKPRSKPKPKPENGEGDEQGEGGEQPGGEQPGGEQGENGQPSEGAGQSGEGDGEEGDDGEDTDLTGDGGPEFDPDAEDDAAQDEAEAEWEQMFDDQLADLGLDRLVNHALEAADEAADELDKIRKGIGLEDGQWQTMSPEERLALAERLRTPWMKELADVIGRMKRFALGIRAQRIVDVPHEAFDVTTGDSLPHLLNSQWALLANDLTRYEFYRRYSEKELLQFKLRGSEEVGKGPIEILIDKSGSMSGKPFAWAMAVAEALRRFAADEDRDYHAMFFGNNNDRERFSFPKGKGPFEKVLAFLSCAANGGTQFDGVLTEGLKRASEAFDGEGRGKADIVFITDGMAPLSEDWIANFNTERKRVGVRVYSVYIGGATDMNRKAGPLGLLQQISDVTIPVKELRPESAKAIFANV